MNSSTRKRADRVDERAISLTEVVVCVGILAALIVPLITLTTSNQRLGHTAQRLVDVTLHAQVLLESIASMRPEDLPVVPAGSSAVFFKNGVPPPAGGPQFTSLLRYLGLPPPLPMERTLTATRLPTGELIFKINVVWQGVAQDPATRREVTLAMLAPLQ